MKIHWRDAARHYLQVIAFCCVIAVLTTADLAEQELPGAGRLLPCRSGTITWSVIEFGRYLIDRAPLPTRSARRRPWLAARAGAACC